VKTFLAIVSLLVLRGIAVAWAIWAWQQMPDVQMSVHGYAAMILGIVFTLLVTELEWFRKMNMAKGENRVTKGRPPIFGEAMCGAERQARYRARNRRRRQLDDLPQQADIDLGELPPFDLDDAVRFLADRNVMTVLDQAEGE